LPSLHLADVEERGMLGRFVRGRAAARPGYNLNTAQHDRLANGDPHLGNPRRRLVKPAQHDLIGVDAGDWRRGRTVKGLRP